MLTMKIELAVVNRRLIISPLTYTSLYNINKINENNKMLL